MTPSREMIEEAVKSYTKQDYYLHLSEPETCSVLVEPKHLQTLLSVSELYLSASEKMPEKKNRVDAFKPDCTRPSGEIQRDCQACADHYVDGRREDIRERNQNEP